MIMCDKGLYTIKGDSVTIQSELAVLISVARRVFAETYKSKTVANNIVDNCFTISKMSNEDLDRAIQQRKDLAK